MKIFKLGATGSKRVTVNYSADESRDEHGRWSGGGMVESDEPDLIAPDGDIPSPDLEELHNAVLLHHNEVAAGIKDSGHMTKEEHLAHAHYHELAASKIQTGGGPRTVSKMHLAAANAHRIAAIHVKTGLGERAKDLGKDIGWNTFGSIASDLGQKAVLAAGAAVGGAVVASIARAKGNSP
jgi:hypothetical protein